MPSCRYVCCVKHIKQGPRTSVSCILSSAVDMDSLLKVAFQTAALWCCKYPAEQGSLTQEGGNVQSNGDYSQERDINRGCQTATNPLNYFILVQKLHKPQNRHCQCWYLEPLLLLWVLGRKELGSLQPGNRNSARTRAADWVPRDSPHDWKRRSEPAQAAVQRWGCKPTAQHLSKLHKKVSAMFSGLKSLMIV